MKNTIIACWGPGLAAQVIGGAGLVVGLTAPSGDANAVTFGFHHGPGRRSAPHRGASQGMDAIRRDAAVWSCGGHGGTGFWKG